MSSQSQSILIKGSLIVIGLGILLEAHLTIEAAQCLQNADEIFFLANDALVAQRFHAQFPHAVDLAQLYAAHRDRALTYDAITAVILHSVRSGRRVCAAFYGHPGIFVTPAHHVITQARLEGYDAAMLPGISAEDCLFADLGIDPGEHGCQTYEATDFLVRPRQFDVSSGLVLWQVGLIGNLKPPGADISRGVAMLVAKLGAFYGLEHKVLLYVATAHPQNSPQVYYVPLADVTQAVLSSATTMYVPPKHEPETDMEMMRALGLA